MICLRNRESFFSSIHHHAWSRGRSFSSPTDSFYWYHFEVQKQSILFVFLSIKRSTEGPRPLEEFLECIMNSIKKSFLSLRIFKKRYRFTNRSISYNFCSIIYFMYHTIGFNGLCSLRLLSIRTHKNCSRSFHSKSFAQHSVVLRRLSCPGDNDRSRMDISYLAHMYWLIVEKCHVPSWTVHTFCRLNVSVSCNYKMVINSIHKKRNTGELTDIINESSHTRTAFERNIFHSWFGCVIVILNQGIITKKSHWIKERHLRVFPVSVCCCCSISLTQASYHLTVDGFWRQLNSPSPAR